MPKRTSQPTGIQHLHFGNMIGTRPEPGGLAIGKPGMSSMEGMNISSLQGESVPADARSADYSDGRRATFILRHQRRASNPFPGPPTARGPYLCQASHSARQSVPSEESGVLRLARRIPAPRLSCAPRPVPLALQNCRNLIFVTAAGF